MSRSEAARFHCQCLTHVYSSVCFPCAQSFCVGCLAAQASSGENDDKPVSLLQDAAALATWQCLSCQGRCPCALCKMKYRRQRLGGNKSGVKPIAGQAQTNVATAIDTASASITEMKEKHNDGVDLLVEAVDALKVVQKEGV